MLEKAVRLLTTAGFLMMVAGLYIWLYQTMELCSIGMDWSSLFLHSSLKF